MINEIDASYLYLCTEEIWPTVKRGAFQPGAPSRYGEFWKAWKVGRQTPVMVSSLCQAAQGDLLFL